MPTKPPTSPILGHQGWRASPGITDSTMTHGEGWQFIQAGRSLERASALATLLPRSISRVHGKAAEPGPSGRMDRPAAAAPAPRLGVCNLHRGSAPGSHSRIFSAEPHLPAHHPLLRRRARNRDEANQTEVSAAAQYRVRTYCRPHAATPSAGQIDEIAVRPCALISTPSCANAPKPTALYQPTSPYPSGRCSTS